MEQSEPSVEANRLSERGTHWRTPSTIPVPVDFIPLRLVLQPSGATIELTQADMLLGRHSQADVRLPLPDVSRRHCRFFFGQGVWQILDLNSLNGVYLNGDCVRQATIRQGDLIRIGGFTFAVELDGSNAATTPNDASQGLIRRIFRTLPTAETNAEPRRRSA